MRAVADQMRPLSNEACLAANHQGTFKLAVLDSEVVGDASWSGLDLPRVNGSYPTTLIHQARKQTTTVLHKNFMKSI